MNTDNVLKAGKAARERSEATTNWALDANKQNGWAYVGKGDTASNETVRHADLIDPPLTVADGWKALAVVFVMWAGVFVAAPFMFGVGQTLAKLYFY